MDGLPPGRTVTVEVPATSANLGPGFDCFGLALSWREEVELTVTDGGWVVDVTGEGADSVPRDDSHLILRSALRGLADLGHQVPGLRLRCHNTIPHGRGLGSSSAAIVAGLLAAAALVQGAEGESPDRKHWLLQHAAATEGHPDNVAAAIHGGFVLAWTGPAGVDVAVGRVHPEVAATVFVPSTPVATKATRGLLPASVSHRDAARNAGRAALLVHALSADPDHLLAGTADWLHQDQRRPAMPDSWLLMNHLRDRGHAAVISGAGPTVLVLGRPAQLAELEVDPVSFRRVPLTVGGPATVTLAPGEATATSL